MSQASAINWNWYQFQQLSKQQLYDLLKLRQDVFIIEQQCIYPDIDGLDPNCTHLLGYDGEYLTAYLRLIPAEIHDSGNVTLGRIISLATKRGTGIGKSMMKQAMLYTTKHYPEQDVQLAAQYYLQAFYQKFGFSCISKPYDDDGILHVDMLYRHRSDN